MFSRLRSLWRGLRRRDLFESQMAEELRFHVDSRAADLHARGMPLGEARRQARREFGNPAAWQTECRSARRLHLVDDLVADVRFALRGFRQHKMLSGVVIVTLTFGIGVSSGVFTIFSRLLLQPPVTADPGSFVQIYTTATTDRARWPPFTASSVEEYVTFRDGLRSVRMLSAYGTFPFRTRFGAAAEAANLYLVTCNHFEVYGLNRPARGRLLQPSDCESAAPVMVLSHGGWLSYFGGEESVVGRAVPVAGVLVTIVGVAPPSDASLRLGSGWLPYTLRAQLKVGDDPRVMTDAHRGHDRWLIVNGRLTAGTTREQASAELAVVAARSDLAHPGRFSSAVATDGALVNDPTKRPMALSLMGLTMGALSCLVLIACANVATLLLSRAEARQKEIAIRLSLGAGRVRVMRMLLAETLTLAVVAGAASVYVAFQIPRVITDWLAGTVVEIRLTPDWRAFAYLAATVCLAGIAAGLAPALESMRVDVLDSLKGRRSTFGARTGSRFRGVLVTVQVALSFVLVVGSTLFLVTHYQTVNRQVGFETGQVLMPRVTHRTAAGVSRPSPANLADVLHTVPGMHAIAFAQTAPVFASAKTEIVTPEGNVHPISANEVSPGFFAALDLPLLRGRALDERDRSCEGGTCQIVVSESFARRILRSPDPIGRVVRTKAGVTWQVVGVAGDTAVASKEVDPPQAYLPWAPDGRPYQALVRFTGDPASYAPAVAAALRQRFPGASVEAHTLRWPIEYWIEEVGKVESLVVALGGAAVALAAMGIFGIVSFAVARRRQELGVRVALGAAPRDIYATVIGTALTPVALGLVSGVVIAVSAGIAFASVLAKLRLGATATDPLIYAGAGAVLLAIIGTALIVPARRAASIEPVMALRGE
jgi:predicted permease